MSRTERGLIAFALFLLVFAIGEFAAYDYLLTVGDVRVDSNRFGRSEIQPGENTLLRFSKEGGLDSLHLRYGSFSGTIAAGARFMFETGAGEKFELKGLEDAKINVHRLSGNVVLTVLEGHLQVIKAGRIQSLVSRDEIRFANWRKNEIDPPVFTAPKFSVHYSPADSEELEFRWHDSDKEAGGPFVFEIADDPSFKTVWMSQETRESKIAVALYFPKVVYYRVKDGRGAYSQIRRLNLLKPVAPAIAFVSSAHRQSILNLKLTPESRAIVQIAKDPHFQRVFVTRSGVDSKYGFELPAGKYFARARLEYPQFNRDFTPMVSPWSDARALSIP